MTKEEYIESLVSQNLTGKEIVKLAAKFGQEEKQGEEEVKTDDVATQDANVTSTRNEASNTTSKSSGGQSDYGITLDDFQGRNAIEQKAIAKTFGLTPAELSKKLEKQKANKEEQEADKEAEAVKKKEKTNRINSLYSRYNEDGDQDISEEEKSKWLDNNVDIPTDEDIEKINRESSLLDNYFSGFGFYESEEEKALAIQEDKELQRFKYNQSNKDYINTVEEINADKNLSEKDKIKKLNEIKPPALVKDVEVEDIIIDQEQEWRNNAVTWSTMEESDVKKRFTLEDGSFDEKKYNDYKKFMDIDDELAALNVKRNGYTNPKSGMPYGNMKSRYLDVSKKITNLIEQRGKLIAPYNKIKDAQADEITDEYLGGLIGGNRIKYRKQQEVNPEAVTTALSYLPTNFEGIEDEIELDKIMKESYAKFVKDDVILQAEWDAIQKSAQGKIKAYQNEILKTADLTTEEGVADANAKVEAYAKKITLDVFENSKGYKKRLTELGTVMDRAMSKTSTAYKRQQDWFLNFTDMLRGGNTGIEGNDNIPFNNTLANVIESIGKGGVNLVGSAKKALASVEAKGVRNVQRKIDAIDKRVEDGEITKEEGERLKNFKEGSQSGLGGLNSLIEELMEDKEDVEKLFDSIQGTEAYTGLFNASDLSDGISFQEAIFTTGEALPQIGLATIGAASGNPILAGLGTAAMFTQMYGDNYWSAYQEGIRMDAEAMGIDLDAMSPEERRDFEINALNEGKHANMATSAAFAAVMTAAEQFGANKILKKTEEALGLGAGGLVSFYKGSWKQSGEALLRGALNKIEAGGTEFATEFAQEVLGQISTGLQTTGNPTDYLDWGASLEAGKAGGVVGVMIPFAKAVSQQSAVEIRNISRDVAIKFAPNSKYGKFALESEKYFEAAQTNLDNKLKNNELTKEQYQEDSANLADTRNSSLKIDPNASQDIRTRQLDLMVKRNELMRKIKNTDDSDLTQAEQAELKTVKQELVDVVAEQKLYSTSGKVRKIIQDSGPKDSQGRPMIEFRDFSTAKETQQEADNLERQGYTRAAASKAHGVQMINETTGKEVLLINNEVASGKAGFVGNVNVGAHEFLHSVLRKTLANNPKVAQEMRTNMDNYLSKINIENIDPDSKYGQTLALYQNEPSAVSNEEAMVLFADALANGDVELNESALTKLGNVVRRIMQSLGLRNVKFKTGQDVVNFLKDYNKSIEKGKLNRAQRKLLGTEQSMKEDGAIAKESRARATVLEAINALVPQNSGFKKEDYDAFLADPRANKPLFDALLKEGGVINNYVKSRSTTKAEADKAIESLTDRIMNFNPEAKRADGKPVGMKGFGEAIFANTRFAKLDAKKALFKEGEKAKQQKSIDGGTLQIADESTTSKKDDTKLAKKPTQTTGFDKATETKIDEAVNKNFKGPDVKFSQTKNVPKDVAVIYGEELGLNPQTITDKTRNYSKKDAAGLTKAKQFLLKNAKDDYARLPKLKDDFGKGTFVPKNVKDALYTDGKLTGSLKDYMDLIREKPVKPIYRDRVGQTIRGLLNLAIRNRMLETAQPSQAKRLQSGAKFSRALTEPTPELIEGMEKMAQLVNKGKIADALDFVSDPINENNRVKLQEAMLEAVEKYGLDVATIEAGMMSSGGKQTFYGKSKTGTKYNSAKEAKEAGIKTPKKYVKRTNGDYVNTKSPDSKKGTDWVAKPGRLYYSVKDPAYVKLMESAKDYKGSRKSPAKRINTPGKKGKKTTFTKKQMQDNEAQNKINMDTLDHVVNQLADAVEAGMPMEIAGAIIIQSYQATTGLVKIAAPFRYVSNKMEYSTDGKVSDRTGEKFREEHNPPASVVGASILYAIKNNAAPVVMSAIKKNYYQTQLSKKDDTKLDIAKLAGVLPKGKSILDNPVTRLTDAGISLSSITNPLTGKTLAQENNVEVPKDLENDPNVIALQNSLVSEQQRSENPISAKKAKNRINVFTKSLAKPKANQSKALTKQYTPKLPENATTEEKIKTLSNYDATSKLSRALNTPKKGISVFDFDDTLAKTKEQVTVNKLDGTTVSISAAEFAKTAVQLEEDGAQFDFSEFENVSKGTQKGPLADLALKRQEKFGSKDIFVLTARPQIAAQGIKKFLDGIGLSLPLANITGLENGSPQAKATWVISKTAEGYNDFYFADDAIKNVKAVKEILDQVDVKSDVQVAKYSKALTFDKIINNILEDSTGIKSEAEFSKARAQTVGSKKGKFSFFTTPSAEDFVGLIYKFLGKGKVGDAQFQFFQDNLIDPYNRAEQAVTRAKISAANDFKALKKSLKTLPKSLSKQTGIGGFTFGQAARVAVWTRQGMEVPGLSKRDAKQLNDFVDKNAELDVFADELINIQKGKPYPAPGQNWLAGNITSDIVNEINKVNRKEYMQEFNENVDIIFSDKVMNKLEAAYGPRYVEALRDILRRMKSGSNRPVGNSRIVDGLLNWLNNSVGAIMFLNTRSAVLQTISAVNFINFGNNNLIAAGKAFANQKQYWKDFMTLFNSPYLVERRDGLKINVSESEIADAVSESSNKPKAFLNLLLSKGFVLTRFADSFAIAAGGSTFYRNQVKAYMKSGMDQKAAEKQAFDDFYAIAETSQQSSNPSKISQQQASGAGRVILAFANTPMQYARIIKRATQDLAAGRGDWKTNMSKIVYYGAMQNLIFNALQTALFALAFDEEEEEKEDKTGRIANGMADSLLRGLGIQGAAVAAIKDALFTIYEQANKEKGAPEFRKAISDLFGFSPPLDSKIRKLTSGANTFSWEQEKMSQEGFNLNNPAYLAFAQVLAGITNVPLDRAIQKINNLRAATSDSSAKWQKVALLMGWSTWDLGLPYYGVEDKEVQTPQTILRDKVNKMKKETSAKQQKETLLELGLSKQQIKALKYEDVRIKKIIELQNLKK